MQTMVTLEHKVVNLDTVSIFTEPSGPVMSASFWLQLRPKPIGGCKLPGGGTFQCHADNGFVGDADKFWAEYHRILHSL